MENLTLVLKINDEDKRFVSPDFISGKLFRQASDIATAFESGNGEKFELDKNSKFVCDVYGNQFTVDEFEEGTDSRKMMKTIYAVVNYVIGNIEKASALLAAESENTEEKN
ncbi:hypothetical protein NKR74_14820 [Bacillus sp. 3103sda1]|uniref:phage tail assembly chaperone G n=1 Tax=Bacillus sp. 3103sda1 TaxID=2953808 RepID=UPI00209FE156|nr:hypothetical protein [Bacillus sp. 3103sda1]MCP1124561.1 hypothetical protein [Bacillus sp. 3103sda1]